MDFLRQRIKRIKLHWLSAITLVGVLALICSSAPVMARDQYPPRVSYVEGSAAYVPSGKVDWEELTLNLPLLTGDRIFSHPGARVEIEVGEASFLRLGEETDIAFSKLDDRERSFELFQGALILRLGKSRKFEIFTLNSRIEIKKKGLYRISVEEDGSLLVAVRKGRAEIENKDGKTKIKSGEFVWIDVSRPGLHQVSDSYAEDDLDLWSDRRDARNVGNQSVTYVGGSSYPGVYDLDFYGSWLNCPPYGHVWFPRVSVGWSPYGLGRWSYFSFGWTWVSYDPWGWLPYHYGRWIYYSPHHRWCWIPGGFNYWSPAMVDFYWGHGYVGWAPRGHTFINNGTVIINDGPGKGGSGNPARGLTVVRREDFRRGVRSPSEGESPSRDIVRRLRSGLPDDLASPRHQDSGRALARNRETPAPRNTEPGPGAPGDKGRGGSRQALLDSRGPTASDPVRDGAPAVDRTLSRDPGQRAVPPDTTPERPGASSRSESRRVVRTYQTPASSPVRPVSTRVPRTTVERRSPTTEGVGATRKNRVPVTSTRRTFRGSTSSDRMTTIPNRSTLFPRPSARLESRSSSSKVRSPSVTRRTRSTTTSRSTLSRPTGRSYSRVTSRSSRTPTFRSGRAPSSRSFSRPSAPRTSSRTSSGSRVSSRSGRSGRSGKN